MTTPEYTDEEMFGTPDDELDSDALYVQHLENLGYWEARADEERFL